jgi:hypothetical protein
VGIDQNPFLGPVWMPLVRAIRMLLNSESGRNFHLNTYGLKYSLSPDRSPYIQATWSYDGQLQLEASGNLMCNPPLTEEQFKEMEFIGWTRPEVTAEEYRSGEGRGRNPNFVRYYDADPNLVDKSGLNSFVWAYKAKNFSVLRELLIKVRMWSSDKKFNKTIWKQTLQTFEIYHDVINRMSSYHKISKDIFNNQEIKKNKGIVKYNSMLDELASSSESLKNCFDHDGYYDAPHDSSHWLKNKKAQHKYNSKKNSLRIDFNYGKGKFTPTFMQYKDTQMCAYCQKRCGSACDFEYLKEKKAMNKIRVIGSPTKRYNNITEYED